MRHVLAAAPPGTNADSVATETIFWILAVLAVSAALAMILVRRAVHCAIMLAVVMLSLATMYAMLGAPFLAFVQIIVYTGAVLMLFLFVLMLIGISSADSIVETIKGQRLAAGERTAPKPTQRDLAARRLASGNLAPDPGPGVYALHDAADRPALLPDGSTSELSVSPTLSPRDPGEEPSFVPPEETVQITAESAEREAIPGRADS